MLSKSKKKPQRRTLAGGTREVLGPEQTNGFQSLADIRGTWGDY